MLLDVENDRTHSELCTLVESWCCEGLLKAKECPHGWRISSQELKRYLDAGFLRKASSS